MSDNYYICPRCDYKSVKRIDMSRHFKRIRPCHDRHNLELNQEIIEIVLRNHEYHIPEKEKEKEKPNSITKIINNFNTMNNFIAQMETGEKIQHLLEYQQKKTLDFEDGLEIKYEKRVERLEQDKYRAGYFLKIDDLVGLIDDITKTDKDHLERMNIFFDKTIKRFQFYRGKKWESFLEDIGSKELVSLIKSYYLDTYEIYLIRNLHTDYARLNRPRLREHLEIYYQFISIFDLTPHIQDFDDNEIIGHDLIENNPQYLAEHYFDVYFKQKNLVKLSEKNRIKKKIINIVKENTIHNISELNKTVLEILKVDEKFREEIVKTRQL